VQQNRQISHLELTLSHSGAATPGGHCGAAIKQRLRSAGWVTLVLLLLLVVDIRSLRRPASDVSHHYRVITIITTIITIITAS